MLYHVAKDYDGGDLQSLYEQHGNDAYDMYIDKWPEAGELVFYHVHYIHLHNSLDDAQEFVDEFGGEILVIDDADLTVERDNLEYDHPIVRDTIPAEYIRRLK